MDKAKATGIINEIMGLDISKLPKNKKLSEISEWDSFNNLMLISKFQEEYGVEFTAAEIEDTQTIADIFKLLEKKVNSK